MLYGTWYDTGNCVFYYDIFVVNLLDSLYFVGIINLFWRKNACIKIRYLCAKAVIN